MKCKNRIYKYSFYILLGIVLILIVPIIIGYMVGISLILR